MGNIYESAVAEGHLEIVSIKAFVESCKYVGELPGAIIPRSPKHHHCSLPPFADLLRTAGHLCPLPFDLFPPAEYLCPLPFGKAVKIKKGQDGWKHKIGEVRDNSWRDSVEFVS